MPHSQLSWKLADFEAAGIDPPEVCLTNPELSEGEMMTADEVQEFTKDSVATLRILHDKGSDRLEAVTATYYADLAYLLQLGTLEPDEYDELTHPSVLRFD